jgi:hypothetical protein
MEPGSSPEALDPSRLLGRRVEAEHELDEEDGVVDRLANGPPDRLAGRAAHSRPDRGLGLLGHPLEGSRLRRLIDEPADVGGEGGELVRRRPRAGPGAAARSRPALGEQLLRSGLLLGSDGRLKGEVDIEPIIGRLPGFGRVEC